ncbi:MAG: thioredoxin fold domain-containing protein [Deltaproteobacteria bacterium]|nr:thioredoxin fold domain-containing protein [Deltaproteobacteria bacterium]
MVANQSFEKQFKHSISTGVSLVDFNAPWCKPCRAQEPIIKTLEKDYHGTAWVTTLNIDENRDIALKLGIQSIPTIIIYKDGREMNRFVGIQTTETLNHALQDVIDQPTLLPPRR